MAQLLKHLIFVLVAIPVLAFCFIYAAIKIFIDEFKIRIR